jgi:hypothetical protein
MKILSSSRIYLLLLLLLTCAVFLVTGYVYYRNSYPQGDEPHYLIISQTMLKYHSIDVMQDYTNGDYLSFYPKHIDPHTAPNARGQALPLHGIGGPFLWLPFFAWLERLGAIIFICLISALAVYNVYKLLEALGISQGYRLLVSLGFALGSPIYIYAHLTFIEPIAASLCIYILRVFCQKNLRILDLVGSSIALGILPWVHIRFALIELLLFSFLLYRLYQENKWTNLGRYIAYLTPVIALFLLYEVYVFFVWGSLNPAAHEFSSGNLPFRYSPFQGLLGIFMDQEFGLFTNFPIFLFALPGIILALKKKFLPFNVLLLLLFAPYILMYASFSVWSGGWNPPTRYLLVLTPTLAFYIAYALQRANNLLLNICFGLFTLFSFAIGAAYIGAIKFGFNGGHGQSLAMAHLEKIIHIHFTRYIPSLYLPHQTKLFLLWAIGAACLTLLTLLFANMPLVRKVLSKRLKLSVGT